MDPLTLQHDLAEAEAELRRHHRDFAAISAVLDDVDDDTLEPVDALRKIRGIVG